MVCFKSCAVASSSWSNSGADTVARGRSPRSRAYSATRMECSTRPLSPESGSLTASAPARTTASSTAAVAASRSAVLRNRLLGSAALRIAIAVLRLAAAVPASWIGSALSMLEDNRRAERRCTDTLDGAGMAPSRELPTDSMHQKVRLGWQGVLGAG